MGRRVAKSSVRAILEGQSGSASSVNLQERPITYPTPDALLAFGEEFGRMVARRLMADPNRRRGYSLPVGMVGLAFNATMLVVVYCLVVWLQR